MLNHFVYIIAMFAVANQTLPVRITGRNPFGYSMQIHDGVVNAESLCRGMLQSVRAGKYFYFHNMQKKMPQ